jgi:mannose-6-phosphate isomerase-like protein (cupin superfamily)
VDTDQNATYQALRAQLDSASFTTNPQVQRIDKPWGYELLFTPTGLPYVGKLIHVDEGKRLSLQAHDAKTETWLLAEGKVTLLLEDQTGELQEIPMQPDTGYHCQPGQRHRLVGGSGGGSVFEVSSPETGTTFRLEDDYDRPDETEEARQQDRNL